MEIGKLLKKNWYLLIWGILIVFQIIIFHKNIIPPFGSDYIITKGLVCTCPDATVIKGQDFLISNTPDSLKNFNLDYSEIWLTERPTTISDYQGSGQYIIYGQVISKEQVSESDPWNPILKVHYYKEVNPQFDNILRAIILLQILALTILVRRKIKTAK